MARSRCRRSAALACAALAAWGTTLAPMSVARAAGASIRKVLSFDGNPGQMLLPAKTAPNLLTPSKCRTFTYQAGADEVAVVSVSGTVTPSLETDASLRLAVTRSTPFQPFVAVNVAAQIESMADGTALVSARARVPLAEGTTYQFGAGFAADEETLAAAFLCQGVVIVYALEP